MTLPRASRIRQRATTSVAYGITVGTPKTTPSPHILFVLHPTHDLRTDKPFKISPSLWLVEETGGMLVGGVDPHRFDIWSMTMLKGDHIWSASRAYHHSLIIRVISSHHDYGARSVIAAIEPTRKVGDFSLLLNVRVREKDGANEAIVAGTDLSYFTTSRIASSLPSLLRYASASAGRGRSFSLRRTEALPKVTCARAYHRC